MYKQGEWNINALCIGTDVRRPECPIVAKDVGFQGFSAFPWSTFWYSDASQLGW